ncbi:tetratricopeptide repeat protein 1 [Massarina eburnea CBS 473.64]|uniref:Tetratricopeptide repeat protein 1 n=1 Tax=Massarina eburnea CBS 473.64 TaxID=1395130 RepID=A0A6A6RQK5_9PLEO|nr:tetratricopeptide repeat protein 1 [Massarina eburnea CBS 473.64]
MAYTNGANGANGVNGHGPAFPPERFSKVPESISVAVAEDGDTIDVEIALDEDIQDDPEELCTLLENEKSAKSTWVTVAIAYAKHKKLDVGIEVLVRASQVWSAGRAEDRLSILNGLCWLYLLKVRESPRMNKDNDPSVRTKDFYIQNATSCLNDASRISPSYPPLYLARGVTYLLRASLTIGTSAAIINERMDTLKQAMKCFDDALRNSNNRNLMAKMGRARCSYSMNKYADALKGYQSVLESSPGLVDPDPRIGIGCCYWQLGHKDDAAGAWQRSLDLNPKSKIALLLLGLYTLHRAAQLPAKHPEFAQLNKKALAEYIVPAMKIDNMYPLTCAALGSYYNMRKDFDKVETLARRAIELTDVNAIASDGWYQLARKEHQLDNTSKAMDAYSKADQARGGDERGYIPAKFGSAQMRVIMQDYDGAKFRLEKIVQQQPAAEAQTLLGTLYAEDVFNAQATKSTEDKSAELKKALKYLEDVQKAWKDPKKRLVPDPSVLLNLARLYEADFPDKSLKCLEEVEQMELDGIPEEDYPEDIEDETERKAALRELLPPQLLNNMACFHYQAERYPRARDLFQTALNACVKAAAKDETIDTDALVTSISYNLGRTYEVEGMLEDAKGVFQGLLKRHPDYIDAKIRLTYIALRQSPSDEGPKAIKELFVNNEDNLEVRALWGWFQNKSKGKRQPGQVEDQEQRHYKHTLQKFDKHDQYSLTGMGNTHLAFAREMRNEADKEKRRKTYERAVEFFAKVLQLDPKSAYAAQGIAIALAEDKKDYSTALQILTKVRDAIKDYNVYMNLGHTYAELKQYARAIENYELALSKDRSSDINILACLGRIWLQRAKQEGNLSYMKTALEYSQEALKIAPTQSHLQFNVGFVQFQIAMLVYNLKDTDRTVADIKEAQEGLEAAINTLTDVANSPNPPYPKNDLVQRAMMGKNTMINQLQRALDTQGLYEKENANKLEKARLLREADQKRREEEKRAAEEATAERRRKILEDRRKLEEQDRHYMDKRADEERRRQELIDDSEVRKAERRANRGKGGSGKRKKKSEGGDSDSDGVVGSDSDARPRRRRTRSVSGAVDDGSDEERPKTKKRKLARKAEPAGKFKSAEFVDSDSDGDADAPTGDAKAASGDDDGDEGVAAARPGRKANRVISEDEDEDDGVAAPKAGGDVDMEDEEE